MIFLGFIYEQDLCGCGRGSLLIGQLLEKCCFARVIQAQEEDPEFTVRRRLEFAQDRQQAHVYLYLDEVYSIIDNKVMGLVSLEKSLAVKRYNVCK